MLTTDQERLDQLISVAPPQYNQKRTFFDVSRNHSSELVISRWYQYYLDPKEDHGLGSLFVDTLMELVDAPFTLSEFSIHLEQITKKGNFIDILIKGNGRDLGKYIIIENKIHHHINNDLSDYWDHCVCDDSKKAAVLLTLKSKHEYHEKFQNVLHIRLLNIVLKRLENGSYAIKEEQRFLFNNFYSAIENLNRYTTMSPQAAFFIHNTDEIDRFISFKEEAKKYVISQLGEVAFKLNMKLGGTDNPRMRDLVLPGLDTELNCSMIFDLAFQTGNELRIAVGLTRKNLNRWHELDEMFADEIDNNTVLERNYNRGTGWHNYLTKRYQLTEDLCSSLSSFLAKEIENNILPMAEKVGKYLKNVEPSIPSANTTLLNT